MKEEEKAAIERLASQLKGKQSAGEQSQFNAGDSLSQDELRDLARVEVQQTIGPWAAEFAGSGLYDQIYRSLRDERLIDAENIFRVSLSDEIVHPWRGSLYTAWFFIGGDRFAPRPKFPVCNIQRRPLFGMNWVVAMGDRDRELQFNLTRPEELLVQAHPILTFDFAEQIKDGTVWNELERSLHRPPMRHATEEERREYGRSRYRLRDQYLARWGNIT